MSDLEPIQRSRLGEIGHLLAKAREEKGLTLEEVSGKTLIRAAILRAIEEGDERPLPEPVYIRGFIRRFGDLVGLNGMELCDSFPWQPSGSVPLSFVSAGNIVAATPAVAQPVATEPAPQESVEAAAPITSEPQVEPGVIEVSEGAALDLDSPENLLAGDVLSGDEDAPLAESTREVTEAFDSVAAPAVEDLEVNAPGQNEAASIADIAVDEPEEAVSWEQATVEEPVAVVEEPVAVEELLTLDEPVLDSDSVGESALPEHESAYDSRAALFGNDTEQVDASGAAAVTGGGAAIAAQSQALDSNTGAAAMGSEKSIATNASAGAGMATLPPPPVPVMYREPERRNLMPWILALVAGAVGLGITALAFGGGNRQNSPNVANAPAPIEQVETAGNGAVGNGAVGNGAVGNSVPGSEAPAAAPTAPKAAVPSNKVVLELEVKGTEEAWMDVLVDGELQIEGNQVPGFKQRWEGKQEIELATARPDMVWISVNGSKPQPFGKFEEAKPVKIGGFKPANAE